MSWRVPFLKRAIVCVIRKTILILDNWLECAYVGLTSALFNGICICSLILLNVEGKYCLHTEPCCYLRSYPLSCASWWSSWVIIMKRQLLMSWSLCGKRSSDLITSDLLLLRRCLKSFTLLNLSSESKIWYQTLVLLVVHLHEICIVMKYLLKSLQLTRTKELSEAEVFWV